MSQLSAEDLNLISQHIGNIFNDRIKSTEDILEKSMKGLQLVHETNYDALYKKIEGVEKELEEVKKTGQDTNIKATKTNGRVNRLDGLVDGIKDSNGKIVYQGIVADLKEIKQYRFIYKDWYRIVVILSLMSALFIKESRDWIFGVLKFVKGI